VIALCGGLALAAMAIVVSSGGPGKNERVATTVREPVASR
jgi:hypothetical protein